MSMKKWKQKTKRMGALLCAALMAVTSVISLGTVKAEAAGENINYEDKICATIDSSAFIDKEGNLWTWGSNNKGKLGIGSTSNANRPTKVVEEGMGKVKSVHMASMFTVAVTESGEVWTWGRNIWGLLGDGTKDKDNHILPQKITSLGDTKIKKVVNQNFCTLALDQDNNLWIWGQNAAGAGEFLDPAKAMTNIKEIKSSQLHSGALSMNGNLYMWGDNSNGMLGDGTCKDKTIADAVLIDLPQIKQYDLGGTSSCAVSTEGELYTWGNDSAGQLGYEVTTEDEEGKNSGLVPAKVPGMTKVAKAYMGPSNGAAIKEDGSLWLWGKNVSGIIDAKADTEKIYKPTKVMEHVVAADLGSEHVMAVTEDGSIYTWGDNTSGQLGRGSNPGIAVKDAVEISKNEDVSEGTTEAPKDTTEATTEAEDITTVEKEAITYLTPGTTKSIKVKASEGTTITYSSNNKQVVTVDQNGTMKAQGYGVASIEVMLSAKKADNTVRKTVLTAKIKVIPKKATVTKAVSTRKKTAKINWKKDATVNRCQIQISTSKNFKSNVITRTRQNKSGAITFKNLKSGKTYYVRVRSLKATKNGNYCGTYSAVKKLKVK